MTDKYCYEMTIKLPDEGRTLVYTRDGIITAAEVLHPDKHVVSTDELIELAASAGYQLVIPDTDL